MPEDRMGRERRTVDAMIAIHCRGRHSPAGGVCPDCAALMEYAHERLARCRFGEGKPTCANCPVHCYRPEMRERIRQVMRYSGPRMLLRHPYLAVRHLRDGRTRVILDGDDDDARGTG